jgi:outer membrane immunogenic protein
VNEISRLENGLDKGYRKMKKALLSTVAFVATITGAVAADLPSRKAPVIAPPPPPMWTGFYAGLNAGYNFGTNANVYSQNWGGYWTDTPYGPEPLQAAAILGGGPVAIAAGPVSMDAFRSNTQSGFIGGGQVGYNMQYGSNLVLGIEADIQGTNTQGTSSGVGASSFNLPTYYNDIDSEGINSTAVGQTTVQGGVDWLGTVRGRLGYLWTPTLLFYGTGGLAYGNAYANVVQSAVEIHSRYSSLSDFPNEVLGQASWMGGGRQSQILTGWTAGGGIEWMFMPNWSLKAEALYWDLGRMNVNTASFGISPDPTELNNAAGWGRTSVNYSGVIARAGVNYHFNWGAAPVVASY